MEQGHITKKAKLHELDTPSSEQLLGNKSECIRTLAAFLNNTSVAAQVCLVSGPTGSGKSFVVKRVCEMLDYEVVDLDIYEKQEDINDLICRVLAGNKRSIATNKRLVLLVDNLMDYSGNAIKLILRYGNSTYVPATKRKSKKQQTKKITYTLPLRKTIPVIITTSIALGKSVLDSCKTQIAVKPASVQELSRYLKAHDMSLSDKEIELAHGDIRYLTQIRIDPVFTMIDSSGRLNRFQVASRIINAITTEALTDKARPPPTNDLPEAIKKHLDQLNQSPERPVNATARLLTSKLDLFLESDTDALPDLIKEKLDPVRYPLNAQGKPLPATDRKVVECYKVEARRQELISLGDLMTQDIRRNQHWDLLPYKGVLSCVGPTVVK